jgi:hypothetical protein
MTQKSRERVMAEITLPHATKPINVDDLIRDGTTLIELIEILHGRDFSFVLANRRITGYVHYSCRGKLFSWTEQDAHNRKTHDDRNTPHCERGNPIPGPAQFTVASLCH